MRTLNWRQLTREDIAFTHIQAATHFWPGGNCTVYQGDGRADNMLFYMLEGCRRYRFPDSLESMDVHSDDLMLMPAGSCYESTVQSPQGTRGICLQFTLSDASGERCRLGERPMLLRQASGGPLKSLLENMQACSLQYGSRLRIKALMMELMMTLCDSPLSTGNAELLPAIRHMEEHLDHPVSVEEIAALCHMSQSAFTRRFRLVMDESPAAYHRKMRLKKSRELLMSGLYTVEQAASTLGFYDTAHFCRAYAACFWEPAGLIRRGRLKP